MAAYDFECEDEHVTEHLFPIGTAPEETECGMPILHYPAGPERQGQFEGCTLPAKRLLSTGTTFMINKVMSAPSKRLKPGHIGR